MSSIQQQLQEQLAKGLHELFSIEVTEIVLQETKKEFEGAYTLVVFPYTKQAGKAPVAIATDLGNYLLANCSIVKAFQVVQGFLNISIQDSAWLSVLAERTSLMSLLSFLLKNQKTGDSTSHQLLETPSEPANFLISLNELIHDIPDHATK